VTAAALVSLSVVPATPILAPGETARLQAVGRFADGHAQVLAAGVAWSSGTSATATIDPDGLAHGAAAGTSTITATAGVASGTALLTVTATPPGLDWPFLTTSPAKSVLPCNGSVELTGVAWSGSQFVVGDPNGAIYTSPDGLAWTLRDGGQACGVRGYPMSAVTWAAEVGRFVSVGTGNIRTSTDGITWTPDTSGEIATAALEAVTWTGAQFVAVGSSLNPPAPGVSVILTSPDGLAWSSRTTGTRGALRAVASSGTLLVATGDLTLLSADGATWLKAPDPSTGWNDLVWAGAQFVEVGQAGRIRTSPDGLAWTERSMGPTVLLNGVTWTGTQLVAVGGWAGVSYPGLLFTSPDGVTWTGRTLGTVGTQYGTSYLLNRAAWSGARLIAVGWAFYVYTSP
jgi:hypothetical protein